ncbi:apm2 [Symbiodinium sp. KB8]|nr:apm2 [Symbiodinium sp. KB8]
MFEGSTFVFKRAGNLFMVAVTRNNANAAMIFHFMTACVEIFRGYFNGKFDEETLRNNFSLVYELLDAARFVPPVLALAEILDFGYPQTTVLDILKLYINLGVASAPTTAEETAKMTSAITGARDWRREGIVYKTNQVHIDVLESVNMLVSQTGTVLRHDVAGKILMRTELTGMPECKINLNDKLIIGRKSGASSAAPTPSAGAAAASSAAAPVPGGARAKPRGVELEDVTFHRCVQLSKFDADRSITFVPPDGEFELMAYRISDGVRAPFRIIPVVEEQGDTRVIINLRLSATYNTQTYATNVTIVIPTPPNTARARIVTSSGRARYEPAKKAIVWRLKRLNGQVELPFQADVELIKSTKRRAWVRPPISMDFHVPRYTSSGLTVRTLKVFERSNYQSTKWVRYDTRAGAYQIRL